MVPIIVYIIGVFYLVAFLLSIILALTMSEDYEDEFFDL